MKSFTLLKDLPDAKAGDIYKQREVRPDECENATRNSDCIKLKLIKNSPDWFKEVNQILHKEQRLDEIKDELNCHSLSVLYECGHNKSIEIGNISSNKQFCDDCRKTLMEVIASHEDKKHQIEKENDLM